MAGALTDDTQRSTGAQETPARSMTTRTAAAVDALWRFLRRPSVVIVLALLLGALLLLTRFIPQIPGQAAEDPASAARWLNVERDAWGAWGGLLRTLGLFNITSSPLYVVLLALLTLVCGVHLAAQIVIAGLPRRLHASLDAPAGVNPLPLAGVNRVHRLRVALAQPPRRAVGALHAALVDKVAPIPLPDALPAADGEPSDEVRILAAAGMRGLWLRPLLPAGALLALAVLWIGAVFGWNVRPPALAPGDTFISAPHSVAITYTVPAPGSAILTIRIGAEGATLVGDNSPARASSARVQGATVRARSGAPALLLRTDAPLLALPGATESHRSVGLVFTQVGSEQIVLLPQSGEGVRVVRLPDNPSGDSKFLVESYARDGVQPQARVEMGDYLPLTLPLSEGALTLQLLPTVGMNVSVRSAPGGWLLWPALALMLLGLAGVRKRPRYVLGQLQPWPVERSVLTLQSSDAALAAAVADAVAGVVAVNN